MKTLNKFMIKSYLAPFTVTFFISIFILVMQFLWKYVDDLVGKGFEWIVIAKLLFYASATLVPLALPLAILLSSIMTFGNLAEHYELVTMKSSGMSLQKIMRPLIMLACLISGAAFYFSNNILPIANLKMGSLLYDVRESKPAFNLREKVFYSGIEGYSIRVEKKGEDGKSLNKIMIYDHTQYNGNTKVIVADSGRMDFSADKIYLILTLYRGHSYEEMQNDAQSHITKPHIRNTFDSYKIYFDLSGFKLTRTDEELFKNNYQMLTIGQLEDAIDSMNVHNQKKKDGFYKDIFKSFYCKTDKFIQAKDSLLNAENARPKRPMRVMGIPKDIEPSVTEGTKRNIYETALNIARSAKAYNESLVNDLDIEEMSIVRHKAEWHKKFTLSFACLVLFFIGAPLGAIIRKGGFGMPAVVSVLFFILFHVLSITGEKLVKEGALPPYQGMWMASCILLPIGVLLTYKATTDSSLFDIDAYIQPFRKLFQRKKQDV